MSLRDHARNDLEAERDTTADVVDTTGATASFSGREATVMAGGEKVTVEPPTTVQTDDESGTWLSGDFPDRGAIDNGLLRQFVHAP